ncbi:MAG: hypothetical protein ACQEUO_11055 [Bacillota bacterium]
MENEKMTYEQLEEEYGFLSMKYQSLQGELSAAFDVIASLKVIRQKHEETIEKLKEELEIYKNKRESKQAAK